MIVYRARTKAGRAWIEMILASAIRIDAIEIDLITDKRSARTVWRDSTNGREPMPATLRGMFSDRYTEIFDQLDGAGNTFVMLVHSGRTATRFEITTYAYDPTGLPEIKPEDAPL